MPRTLPWLSGNCNIKRESTPQKPSIKPDSPAVSEDEKPDRRDFLRSSQSPPISPIHRCPSEESLIPGLEHDDIYIMVEDEFHSIAQSFTQHLHYAEYMRKKKEAKTEIQNRRDIARPTDGTPLIAETKVRKEREVLGARQRKGLEEMDGREGSGEKGQNEEDGVDEEDEEWAGTFLYDLMTSPRKTRTLVEPGELGVRSSTRAAAGFSKPQGGRRLVDESGSPDPSYPRGERSANGERQRCLDEEETASEDDDLEVQVMPGPPRQREESADSNAMSTRNDVRAKPVMETNENPSMHARYKKPSYPKTKGKMLFDDIDDLELGRPKAAVKDRRDSVRGAQKGSGDSKSKKSRLNEVPTFVL